jgi:tetratricopeptide (TPR) repeat protein
LEEVDVIAVFFFQRNHPKTFKDVDRCIDFLTDINNKRFFLIIFGVLSKTTVALIHDIAQLHTIFIFCDNKDQYEQWTKEWVKIKDIFTEMPLMYEALKQAVQQWEQNAIPFSFMNTSEDISKKNLDQLECSFMYTQILKEILLAIEFNDNHFKEFNNYCCEQSAENLQQVNKIKEFEQKYRENSPIWWYSKEYFLYSMLNRALRLMDMNILIKMGFFIADLHGDIRRLHLEQFHGQHSAEVLTVYRGQGLSKTDFDQMMNTKGGLISFNSFLSTSKNRAVSQLFAESNQNGSDLIVIFVMKIDPLNARTPFAFINNVSYFNEEDEVLFSMHTVFRINDIKPIGESDRLFEVNLTLTSDNDKDLSAVTNRIREEIIQGQPGWDSLGILLLKLGQVDQAQQLYNIMLNQSTTESEKGYVNDRLGSVKFSQGQYEEALPFYQKSLEIFERTLPENHLTLACSYNNIGLLYHEICEYSKAASFHEKALRIRQQLLPPNHPDLAFSHNSLGNVYFNMGKHAKALSSYEKTLEIRQKSLPPNHPDMASSYSNIGVVSYRMGEYPKALSSFKKTIEIQQKVLPSNHPDLAASYNNIGGVYCSIGEYSEALSHHQKSLSIRQVSLPTDHPDVASCYTNIGNAYLGMNKYSEAIPPFEKALEICRKIIPPNHPTLAASYNNIGIAYRKMGQYSNAVSYFEKALEIKHKDLDSNHPDLATSYNNIGSAYYNMGQYSNAITAHKKALEIKQKNFSPNHPSLAASYNNIGAIYQAMENHSEALPFFRRAVDIAQISLPANHPDLQKYRYNLNLVETIAELTSSMNQLMSR